MSPFKQPLAAVNYERSDDKHTICVEFIFKPNVFFY